MPRAAQLALLLALTFPAAAQHIDDPANLMGERVSPQALADDLPIDHGAPALEQLLRKLRTRASLMLIVAHPDDEDSGMLTYESRGQGARVAMLTLTRGEGGQNLMSADFNDALGLIRTQELLAEDRYTGTDQFFGTEVDFGFSKTKEESFKKWTHERVLYDAVRAVRLYRPLVLASVFIGGVTDGHGQHQVSGEIAQEVFLAAADPKVFPEMGLPPWAPLRVYARVPFAPITAQGMFDYATGKYLPPHFHNYVTGQDTTTPPQATVTIHEGDVPNIPAFNGLSYAQWARQGLALQKTQIGPNFRIPTAGRNDSGYTLYGSRNDLTALASEIGQAFSPANRNPTNDGALATGTSPEPNPDLFTDIDTTLPSIANLAPDAPSTLRKTLAAIDNKTAEAQKLYDPAHLERVAEPLVRALKLLDNLIRDTESSPLPQLEKFNLLHELRVKRVQFNNALMLALGVQLDAQTDFPDQTNGSDVRVKAVLTTSAAWSPNHARTVLINQQQKSTDIFNLAVESSRNSKQFMQADLDASLLFTGFVTRPYFFRSDSASPFYILRNELLRNAPSTPPALIAQCTLDYENTKLEVKSIVAADRQQLFLVPRLSVSMPPNHLIVTANQRSLNFSVHVSPPKITDAGIHAPADWSISKQEANATTGLYAFQASKPSNLTSPAILEGYATAIGGGTFFESYRPVRYPGLPRTNFFEFSRTTVVPVDVTTAPNLRIAYLPGTGDDVTQFLPSLGVTPTILAAKNLTADTLKQYDAVVLGVRAYSAHPELAGAASEALTAYAKQGGVVIVQYSSAGFKPESAPFPYTVPGDSAHNVVEEEHPVTLLAPENPLLTWPNRITSADFDHWIEERGHGFASEWAPQYTPLLEMHDDGQDPQKGGLLVAKVGKGAYIYCALALYRQLPEGVPGAYRLVANLLSYAKNPGR
jgi:LmbE family N-acetylglucosaminyl deacetylase